MMKPYSYKIVVKGAEYLWRIIEERTGNIISDHLFEDDAIEKMKFLGKGGAFDGWTPNFVLRTHSYKYETEDITQ